MTATPRSHSRAAPAAARRGLAIAALLLVAACASNNRQESSGLFSPYRTDLPQGNYVTREMLDQVQAGMTREQVRVALGTPLLNPIFRDDRWDYVFRYQRPNGTSEQRRVSVRFKSDRVDAIEAGDLPAREDPADPALPGARAAAEARARAEAKARAAQPAPAAAAAPEQKEATK